MPAVSIARFVQEVLELYRPPHRSLKTFKKMAQIQGEMQALNLLRKTSDIRPVVIARWIEAHPDRLPVTAHSLLRSFRASCSYALASGYLKVDPFVFRKPARWFDLSPVEDATEPRKHHGIEEIRGVLQLLKSEARRGGWKEARLLALVGVYAYTAVRAKEGLHLKVSDVDLESGILSIRRRRRGVLKTLASRAPVPIPRELATILKVWLPKTGSQWVFPATRGENPWTGGPPGAKPLDQVKAAGLRAGVEGLTIQSLRHSFGTHAARWGLGPLAVKAILRHTKLSTQLEYQHDDLDDLRESVKRVSYSG
jgi:integrase